MKSAALPLRIKSDPFDPLTITSEDEEAEPATITSEGEEAEPVTITSEGEEGGEEDDWYLHLTQDDLPCSDDIPMDTPRHRAQMNLLIETLMPWLSERPGGGYLGGNMFVYFSERQLRGEKVRGPDFYVVLDVPPTERLSWVVWEENNRRPNVVIELLSDSTKAVDKEEKMKVYQDELRVSEYFWYDPFVPEDWAGFVREGGVYRPLERDARGCYASPCLGLLLVRWHGTYLGITATWLRWARQSGELLPTAEERREAESKRADNAERRADDAQRQADDAQRQADDAQRRADKLAAKLRALGLDPNAVE